MNLENSRLWLAREGIGILRNDIYGMGLNGEPPGETYYVDGNKTDDSGDGSTWANAMKYLSTAMAVSHANIAISANRNWAGRNTIYVKADSITENLTVLADKTDIIGVGSQDYYSMPQIVGNHVPTGTNTQSCRFFNVKFKPPAAGGIIWTVASYQPGLQFHGCEFNAGHASGSVTCATIAVKSTATPKLEIRNSVLAGKFSTAAIHLLTGASNGLMIANNIIQSGAIGIDIDSGFSCADEQAYILDNRIFSTGLCIDDDCEVIAIMGNLGVAADATGYDVKVTMAAGNIITNSGGTDTVPFTKFS